MPKSLKLLRLHACTDRASASHVLVRLGSLLDACLGERPIDCEHAARLFGADKLCCMMARKLIQFDPETQQALSSTRDSGRVCRSLQMRHSPICWPSIIDPALSPRYVETKRKEARTGK
jgi:hypothetical protein